jgi:hypothetical protein
MQSPETIEPIVAADLKRALLKRLILPSVKSNTGRRILRHMNIRGERRTHSLTRRWRCDKDCTADPIVGPSILSLQHLVIGLACDWRRTAFEHKVLDSLD